MEKILVIGSNIDNIYNKILLLQRPFINIPIGILSVGFKKYHLSNCEVINVSQERIFLGKNMINNLFPNAKRVYVEGYIHGDITEKILLENFTEFKIVKC